MSIGGSRETFWHLKPSDLLIDFKAHENRLNEQIQLAWLNGYYTKLAIQSSVMVCGLADKSVIRQMPEYPKIPKKNDEVEEEKEIETKRQLMIARMNYWMRMNNNRFKKEKQ